VNLYAKQNEYKKFMDAIKKDALKV